MLDKTLIILPRIHWSQCDLVLLVALCNHQVFSLFCWSPNYNFLYMHLISAYILTDFLSILSHSYILIIIYKVYVLNIYALIMPIPHISDYWSTLYRFRSRLFKNSFSQNVGFRNMDLPLRSKYEFCCLHSPSYTRLLGSLGVWWMSNITDKT